MAKKNQVNNGTEADHYALFLGGLMDELIVKFKNLSLAKKKKKSLQLQSACLRGTGYTVSLLLLLEVKVNVDTGSGVSVDRQSENIKEYTGASSYPPLPVFWNLGVSVFHWNPECCHTALFELKQLPVPSRHSHRLEDFRGLSLGISPVPADHMQSRTRRTGTRGVAVAARRFWSRQAGMALGNCHRTRCCS